MSYKNDWEDRLWNAVLIGCVVLIFAGFASFVIATIVTL